MTIAYVPVLAIIDLADLKFGAGRVVAARLLATEVVANNRRWQSPIGHQTIVDRVAQVHVAGRCRPLVRLLDDLLLQDAGFSDHEQSQISDDGLRQVPVRDVIADDVPSEILALNAAAVREFNLKIELDAFLHHGSMADAD
jgi:hypothetical protein